MLTQFSHFASSYREDADARVAHLPRRQSLRLEASQQKATIATTIHPDRSGTLRFAKPQHIGPDEGILLIDGIQELASGIVDHDSIMVAVCDVDSSARAVHRDSEGEEPEVSQRRRSSASANRERLVDIAAVEIAGSISGNNKVPSRIKKYL